jgi:hypothetical protein
MRNYYSLINSMGSGAAAIDSDAQAFITAASITDSTQQTAINTLVTDLKGYGIWTKMKAIYPFVGGSASSHKWNLKDPRDLDAAYRLVFFGGWTHSITGALPNGTTGYADTKITPSSSLNGLNHLSYYSRSNNITAAMMGIQDDSVSPQTQMYIEANKTTDYYSLCNTSGNNITKSSTSTLGLYLVSRTTSNLLKAYKNGSVEGSNTASSILALSNKPIYLGAFNYWYFTQTIGYGNKEIAFSSVGDGLTDTEAANLYSAVQTYQTFLSRNV